MLPLVVALALLTQVSLPHVLVAFGVFQIVWGVRYGLPISVEPMKALAALAIAGALSLGKRVFESSNLALSAGIGLLAVFTNLGVAFVVGIAVHLGLARLT